MENSKADSVRRQVVGVRKATGWLDWTGGLEMEYCNVNVSLVNCLTMR